MGLRSRAGWGIVGWLCLCATAAQAAGLPGPGDVRPGELLVRYHRAVAQDALAAEAGRLSSADRDPVALRRALTARAGLTVAADLPQLDVQRLRLPAGTTAAEAAERLRLSPLVAYCEPNPLRVALTYPQLNDPLYQSGFLSGTQWWVSLIQADRVAAEGLLPHGHRTVIAILDTGIVLTHPDLQARLETGLDLVDPGTPPDDDHVNSYGTPLGHGTHAAGIAAALTDNGVGIVGTASADAASIRLLPVKVLDADGYGDDYTIAQGIVWAADRGARVINLSVGGEAVGQVLHDAVAYAHARGCVLVAAAGNYAQGGDGGVLNPVLYPAAYPEVVAVAACDSTGARADYSEYGSYIDLAAPGGSTSSAAAAVLSTLRDAGSGPYGYLAGTSMAAPAVSGAAAMLLCQDPDRTAEEVETLLTTTAVKTGRDPYVNGWNPYLGWGRIDLYRALTRAGTVWPRTSGRPSYNYPNPFAPGTGQRTYLVIPLAPGQAAGPVRVRIFDAAGRPVRTLEVPADRVWPGSTVAWDGRNDAGGPVANGVYPYRLELNGTVYANKIAVKN